MCLFESEWNLKYANRKYENGRNVTMIPASEKITPPEKKTLWKICPQSTASEAGEQFSSKGFTIISTTYVSTNDKPSTIYQLHM